MEDENHISTSVSRDFIVHLYLIYGILNLLVLLFHYFLWKIKLLPGMKQLLLTIKQWIQLDKKL